MLCALHTLVTRPETAHFGLCRYPTCSILTILSYITSLHVYRQKQSAAILIGIPPSAIMQHPKRHAISCSCSSPFQVLELRS